MEVERRFLFLLDRNQVFKLRMQISKWVKHRNQDSYKGRLELEIALQIEDEIGSIKQKIKNVLHTNCQFWATLQKHTISYRELNSMLRSQFDEIERIKQLWISVHSYLDYKKKWKFYYAWFTMYILNKKIKNRILENFSGTSVNENDIFSEEMHEGNIEDDLASLPSAIQVDEV
jgi:hypothetical protein